MGSEMCIRDSPLLSQVTWLRIAIIVAVVVVWETVAFIAGILGPVSYTHLTLPTVFVGVRLGMIFALINIVGVEFLINFGGLGQLVNELAERYDLPGTYAAICFVILVSIMFFMATERIERWLRPGT